MVKANGKLLWDKRGANGGNFPTPDEILTQLGGR